MTSRATARWTGGLKAGAGSMKPAHAQQIEFSVGSRFEGQAQSNPEEVIGAALAGCFSMALTLALEQAGAQPQQVQTSAAVKLEKQGEGFAITGIALDCVASAKGIEGAKFEALADATKRGCPVSKALAGTTITLAARLA